jgi:hypothetical protein
MPAILHDTDEGAHTSNYITTTRKSAEYVTNVALVLESLKRIKKNANSSKMAESVASKQHQRQET